MEYSSPGSVSYFPWWWSIPALKEIILWLRIYSFDFLSLNNGTLLALIVTVIFLGLYFFQLWTDWYYYDKLRLIGFLLIILSVFLYYCGVLPLWLVILSSLIYFIPVFVYIISVQI
jgi:membrane-bound ClpP family serine protease